MFTIRSGRRPHFTVLATVAFASALAAAQEPTGDEKPLEPHSEKMRELLPEGIASEPQDRVYRRLFDVEQQIRTTRVLLQRMREVAAHGSSAAEAREKAVQYREVLGVLQDAKVALADLHIQIAECTALCARAEKAAAAGESHATVDHHRAMMARTKASAAALKKLQTAIDDLEKWNAKLEDDGLVRLTKYLKTESGYLGKIVHLCQDAMGDGAEHASAGGANPEESEDHSHDRKGKGDG